MEQKFNSPTAQRPLGDRVIDAGRVVIDLSLFIEQLKDEKQWKNSDRNAITVFKTNGMRIVLIALHKGAGMTKHTADGLISIQVLKGRMELNTEDEYIELGKGQMLALHKGIPHSVLAKKKTFFC
jgi:quercetin dioxygenase-like cupin family protein